MDDSTRTHALLEELRDLVKEQRDLTEAHLERSRQLMEESVARQQSHLGLYRRVLIVAAVVLAGVFVWAWWMLT